MAMLALRFSVCPVGWAACRLLRYVWPGCLVSRLSGLRLVEAAVPELPGDDWVRVRTLLGGICGTDAGILAQKQPPDSILQAFSSMPMILGHENVAVVTEVGAAVEADWVGRRVCVEPTLCCEVRGIDPPCGPCSRGQFCACERFGDGGAGSAHLPPGTSVGYNSRTGGSWGEFFVAHRSRLVPVPESLTDEQAVLTDPLACSLHAVLRAEVGAGGSVLVCGAGMLGLGVIACLRAIGWGGRIDVLGRSAQWEGPARRLGADEFLRLPSAPARRFARIAERTGGTVHRVRFGNRTLSGGYDVVFECTGASRVLGEALQWTRARGRVVLVGTGGPGRIDLTCVWFRELTVVGAFGRQIEHYEPRDVEGGLQSRYGGIGASREASTYQLVHELMAAGKLPVDGLLTHTFALRDYAAALDAAMHKSRHGAVKVAFDFRPGGAMGDTAGSAAAGILRPGRRRRARNDGGRGA